MGCGEGVFVEELVSQGFKNVLGIDLNYSSELVKKENIIETSFSQKQFDIILLFLYNIIITFPAKSLWLYNFFKQNSCFSKFLFFKYFCL